MVGIPTLAATDQQLGGAAPGIGSAIPSNIVTSIAGQIIKTGHVTNSHRAALGVPAGDVIIKVNRTATPDTETLAAVLAGLRPGQQVPVAVTRTDGSTTTVQVTLGQLPGT